MQRPLPFWALLFLAPSLCAQSSTVPFIGCPSDGQAGSLAAPPGQALRLAVPPEAAVRLAWYKATDAPGVLAPRDWHCFGTYGSSGATLYVSPEPLGSQIVLSSEWKGLSGPAVEISSMNGGTSGRFEVAQKIARLFPQHMDFTRQVIAESIEPASDFPLGPYPGDKLTYKTKTLVEFETPAHRKGLGTDSRLQRNDQAIEGFVFLSMRPGNDPYDVVLEMRLPPDLSRFVPVIQAATERTLKTAP